LVADEALREGQYVTGANFDGRHLRGVEAGRDYEPRFADLREAREEDACPVCRGRLRFQVAIEVGHIFKLGTRYSLPLGATYVDESDVERPVLMGSYGIGPGRIMAAAVEQSHDEYGIAWPRSLAPYDVAVVVLQAAGEDALSTADRLVGELEQAGMSVLVDERERRPGEKFADADLIGCPIRVTIGKRTAEDGQVDVRARAEGSEHRVAVEDVAEYLRGSA
jgi:prolyl-tRNA synthetase